MRSALLLALLSVSPALAAVGSVTVVEGPAFRTPKGGAEEPLSRERTSRSTTRSAPVPTAT
jgi:hypothetical protein